MEGQENNAALIDADAEMERADANIQDVDRMTREKNAPLASSINDILEIDDAEIRTVYVKEWNRRVTLRTPAASAIEKWELAQSTGKKGENKRENVRAGLIALHWIQSETVQRRVVVRTEDIAALSRKNPAALGFLFNVCCEMSGIGEETRKEAEQD